MLILTLYLHPFHVPTYRLSVVSDFGQVWRWSRCVHYTAQKRVCACKCERLREAIRKVFSLPVVHICTVDNVVLCVFRVQLTDDVILSTALAVQRFTYSCENAILRVNKRSVDETAIAMPADANTLHEQRCPLCPLDNSWGECCRRGYCVNGTCQCDEGRFKRHINYRSWKMFTYVTKNTNLC